MTRILLMLWITIGFSLAAPTLIAAQDAAEPFVEIELPETEAIPGQPVILRMTVLVPTWLPKPVAFPNLEAPDLMVKLLERSTNPTSRTIEGETWSGVTRAYRLSPMVPGPVQVPAQDVVVTWADPGKTDPLVATVTVDPFIIVGIVPEGAEGLDPFIAANTLTLTEALSTEARVLEPGDSLSRTITVEVTGTSPLFLPTLLPPHQVAGVANYPDEPIVTERADRNWLSGTRVESTTLVAQSGGAGSVPPIELTWYNLETGDVETARIEGFDLSVDGPVAKDRIPIDVRLVILWAGALALACIVGYRLLSIFLPRLKAWRRAHQSAREATEKWAFARLEDTLRQRNYSAFLKAYEVWRRRTPFPARLEAELNSSVTELGASLFGTAQSDPDKAWSDVARAVSDVRQSHLTKVKRAQRTPGLAPLNPH